MEKQIFKEIKELDHVINKYISNGKDPRKYLNMTQMHVLLYLINHENEEICQKDLEAETKLKKASMTGCLDSLQEKGLIERRQAKDDKRRNIITLSSFAKNKNIEIKNRIDAMEKEISKGIGKDELENFFNIIDRIKANIQGANE